MNSVWEKFLLTSLTDFRQEFETSGHSNSPHQHRRGFLIFTFVAARSEGNFTFLRLPIFLCVNDRSVGKSHIARLIGWTDGQVFINFSPPICIIFATTNEWMNIVDLLGRLAQVIFLEIGISDSISDSLCNELCFPQQQQPTKSSSVSCETSKIDVDGGIFANNITRRSSLMKRLSLIMPFAVDVSLECLWDFAGRDVVKEIFKTKQKSCCIQCAEEEKITKLSLIFVASRIQVRVVS